MTLQQLFPVRATYRILLYAGSPFHLSFFLIALTSCNIVLRTVLEFSFLLMLFIFVISSIFVSRACTFSVGGLTALGDQRTGTGIPGSVLIVHVRRRFLYGMNKFSTASQILPSFGRAFNIAQRSRFLMLPK